MTKNQLIDNLSKKTGIQQEAVRIIVEAFTIEVAEQLYKGNDVHIRGFGSFVTKHSPEKKARNINNNKTIIVPAHHKPAFIPSSILKARLKKRSND